MRETFELTTAGDPRRTIRGAIDWPSRTPTGPFPFALLAPGYKSFMDWGFLPELARRLAARGIAAVRFNFSGSGIADDPESITDLDAFAANTYSQEVDDFAEVRTWLADHRRERLDPARPALVGYSRSGGMGLVHAAEAGDYRALALWAPITRILRFKQSELERWEQRGWTEVTEAATGRKLRIGPALLHDARANRERLDVRAAAATVTAPTLVLCGDRDLGVTPDEARELVAAFRPGTARFHLVSGAGHSFGARHPLTAVPEPLEGALTATVSHLAARLTD